MKALICRGSVLGLALGILTAGQAYGATISVTVGDNFFDPPNVNIKVGDTVQWNWVGTVMGHTVTSGTGNSDANSGDLFDTPNLMTSGQFEHTFTEVGVEPYYCIPHEVSDNMTGTVTVSAVSAGGAGIIMFDNASFSDFDGGTAPAFEHTIGGGIERMLVVGVGREEPDLDVTVTYNGVSMTRIPGAEVRIESGARQYVDLFWLDESGRCLRPGPTKWPSPAGAKIRRQATT